MKRRLERGREVGRDEGGRLDPEEEGGMEVGVADGVNEGNQSRRESSYDH
jgi:hypothetical protein